REPGMGAPRCLAFRLCPCAPGMKLFRLTSSLPESIGARHDPLEHALRARQLLELCSDRIRVLASDGLPGFFQDRSRLADRVAPEIRGTDHAFDFRKQSLDLGDQCLGLLTNRLESLVRAPLDHV